MLMLVKLNFYKCVLLHKRIVSFIMVHITKKKGRYLRKTPCIMQQQEQMIIHRTFITFCFRMN